MSLHTVISGIKVAPLTHQGTSPRQEGKERRATHRASADWQAACGEEETPDLVGLGVGEATGGWHDRFLIRSDEHMPHAVFIACGATLKSDWDMERLGETIQATLPSALCGRFAEGCERSLEEQRLVVCNRSKKASVFERKILEIG